MIAFLILTSTLPFDSKKEDSDAEIIKQTINNPVYYNAAIWSKISNNARNFVES